MIPRKINPSSPFHPSHHVPLTSAGGWFSMQYLPNVPSGAGKQGEEGRFLLLFFQEIWMCKLQRNLAKDLNIQTAVSPGVFSKAG